MTTKAINDIDIWAGAIQPEHGDMSQPGIEVPASAYVIKQYRSQDANLRTELSRIIFRTGNQPWEKPFINMRASCRTELENTGKYATHVLNA